MALDTKQKRGSATGMGLPFRVWLADPDGALAAADRVSLLRLCSAVAPEPVASGAVRATASALGRVAASAQAGDRVAGEASGLGRVAARATAGERVGARATAGERAGATARGY